MKFATRAFAIMLALIPAAVLVGWMLDNQYLKSVIPGLTPMNPLTAICFLLLAGTAFAHYGHIRSCTIITRFVGLFVLLVGLTMLLKYVSHIDLQIDRLLFTAELNGNRLAPNTALNFILIGTALLVVSKQQRETWNRRLIYTLVSMNAFISMLSIIGYIYGVRYLFSIPGLNPMAIHTATCFLMSDIIVLLLAAKYFKFYINKSVIGILFLTLLLEVGGSILSQSILKRADMVQSRDGQVQHAFSTVSEYELSMVHAETGQRGYLLTGKSDYLNPYSQTISAVPRMLATMDRQLDKLPLNLNPQIADLNSNTTKKLAELATTIQLEQANQPQKALAIVETGAGKQYQDNIHGDVATINATLSQYLKVITSEQSKARDQLNWVLAVVTVTNTSLIICAFILVQRAIKHQDDDKEAIRANLNTISAEKSKDEALLGSIADGVFALDNKLRITMFNAAASDISGFSRDDVIGKRYDRVLDFKLEATGKIADGFITKALHGQRTHMENHTELIRKDGTVVAVADSAAPIIDNDQKQQGVIVVFRDVSKERMLEQAQDEFVSLTSHQLRTPLTAIRLFVELLADTETGKLNAEQQDYVSKVSVSTNRMIQLVGDILNISRIQLGQLNIDPVPTDIKSLIAESIEEVRPLAAIRSSTISFEYAHDIPKLIDIDPILIGQVVHNYLTNALRYTETGKGEITVRLERHDIGYRLSVADNGIGIPKAAQTKIFQRFFRADNAIKAEGEGSGLGLYLIKMIMDSSGGSVGFESSEGNGTTFYATIPITGMKAKVGTKTLAHGKD